MKPRPLVVVGLLLTLILASAMGWRFWALSASSQTQAPGNHTKRAIPVEAADVISRSLEESRTFSGTLEAAATFRVAPKVGGRIKQLNVNLADSVANGAVVAVLDSAEYAQDVAQAQANLAVVQAAVVQAQGEQEIAARTFHRQSTLRDQGVVSDAQLDTVRSEQLASASALQVAQAQVLRAQAALETAGIRLRYTQVTATWNEPAGPRVVARRLVQEGDTVAANADLFEIVALNPLTAILNVDERAYSTIAAGQPVVLQTNAFPGRHFPATVSRVSPIFETTSRQARVELTVPNADAALKPGMFIQAHATLRRISNALVVPEGALFRRHNQSAVFAITPSDDAENTSDATVRLIFVETGIRNKGHVQLIGTNLKPSERVITLGQPLLEDSSLVRVIGDVAGPPLPTNATLHAEPAH